VHPLLANTAATAATFTGFVEPTTTRATSTRTALDFDSDWASGMGRGYEGSVIYLTVVARRSEPTGLEFVPDVLARIPTRA
jgi:hypothetical protein